MTREKQRDDSTVNLEQIYSALNVDGCWVHFRADGASKVQCIRVIRQFLNWSLLDAKQLVDKSIHGFVVIKNLDDETARRLRSELLMLDAVAHISTPAQQEVRPTPTA